MERTLCVHVHINQNLPENIRIFREAGSPFQSWKRPENDNIRRDVERFGKMHTLHIEFPTTWGKIHYLSHPVGGCVDAV